MAEVKSQTRKLGKSNRKSNGKRDVDEGEIERFLAKAKDRGYVTRKEVNKYVPKKSSSKKQIAEFLAVLSEMGITVRDGKRPDDHCDTALNSLNQRQIELLCSNNPTIGQAIKFAKKNGRISLEDLNQVGIARECSKIIKATSKKKANKKKFGG